MTKEQLDAAITAVEATIASIDTWVLPFAALVAIGVFGEAVLGVRHWINDRELRGLRILQEQMHQKELMGLHREAAEANARAAEANLKLARMAAPRTLTPEQERRVVAKIAPYAGMQFDFEMQQEQEPRELMTKHLAPVLRDAKWIWVPWRGSSGSIGWQVPGMPVVGITAFTGIEVRFHHSHPEWEGAALALSNALVEEGIASRALRVIDDSVTPNAIHIVVGAKPL